MRLHHSNLRSGTQNMVRIGTRLLHSDVDHLAVPRPWLWGDPDE